MVTPSSDDLRTWADAIGPDTPLARYLLLRGRLPLDLLQATLNDVRAARPEGGTLAGRLVERGLVEPEELRAWKALLASEAKAGHVDTWPAGRVVQDERLEAWRPGAVVADHRLVSRIGAGGMGSVDLAEHLPTGARRAIKSIPSGADPDLVLRFQREAEAMARAGGHPAVARIHAVGHALGRLYLILDLLPGGDLEQRLRQGPLPAAEVARLGVALAGGLAHVHARGFLHRDLKPSNVLFDDAGRPVLVDFGLVGATDRATGTAHLTRTGDLLGTPAYMAPEQALGLSREQDERTDVHGLGAVLYRALTGQHPFPGTTPYEVLEKVINATPAPPSSLVPSVPPALEAALLRALAKRPDDRFPSASAMGEALAAMTAVAPPTSDARATRAGSSRGVLLGLLGLVLGLVLGAAGRGVLWGARPSEPTPELAGPAPRGVAASGSASPLGLPAPAAVLPATIDRILAPPRLPPDSIGVEHASVWRLIARDTPEFLRPVARLKLAQALKDDVVIPDRPPDDPRAVIAAQLLRELAGEPLVSGDAWFELAYLFEHGVGVQRSDEQAAACFAASAEAGDDLARVRLGCALRDGGLDQPIDRAQARALLGRAARPDSECERLALVELARLELADGAPSATLAALGARLREEGAEAAVLAAIRGRLGDPAAEEATLRRQLEPGTPLAATTLLALHALLVRAGRVGEAERLLEDAEGRARDADMDLAVARLHRDAGRPAAAARSYERRMRDGNRARLWAAADAAVELLALCEAEVAAGRPAPANAAAAERLLSSTYEGRLRLARLRRAPPR